jgi:hypothetical protein
MIRMEGMRGFYKGLAAYLIHVTPNICIVFLIYEKFSPQATTTTATTTTTNVTSTTTSHQQSFPGALEARKDSETKPS